MAKDQHNKHLTKAQKDTMVLYTDESGINGQIGAATYNRTTSLVTHQYFSPQTHYHVYSGELTAIHMGIEQWIKQCGTYSECYIFIDNQAICSSIQKPGRKSGQIILKSIINQVDDIADRAHHCKLTIMWVSGHSDIEGNERADQYHCRTDTLGE